MSSRKRLLPIAVFLLCLLVPAAYPQKMDSIERDRLNSMLKGLKDEIRKNYYDPAFHSIDLDERFKKAEERLKQVQSIGQGLAVIAQVLLDFDDSHLYFIPPSTNTRVEYGWRMQMVGEKCFVIAVKPKSDAEAKGLRPGDEIVAIEGYHPTRKDLWKMQYYYNGLQKKSALRLSALSPGADQPRDLTIESHVTRLPNVVTADTFFLSFDFSESRNDQHLFQRVGDTVIWRMPGFDFDPDQADSIMEQRVNGAGALVLDLRTNGGGYIKTLEHLTGYFFDRDVTIAQLKGRKPMDPIKAKAHPRNGFKGKLVVLIGSQSGSAAEIFARLVQLEKRGTVLGDVSAGAVMQARGMQAESGSGAVSIFYGASVTNADVIMSDGKSVEKVGVVPDELMLPTAEDLAKGRDPVLARAIELLGGKLSPEDAGRFFPYAWDKTM